MSDDLWAHISTTSVSRPRYAVHLTGRAPIKCQTLAEAKECFVHHLGPVKKWVKTQRLDGRKPYSEWRPAR